MTGPHSVIAVCTPQCHPLWDDQEPMWVTVKTDLASAEAKRWLTWFRASDRDHLYRIATEGAAEQRADS